MDEPAEHVELLTPNQTRAIADLQMLLADEFVHAVRTLSFHWNVDGSRFLELHRFFQELYEGSLGFVDELAERIRTYGSTPLSSMAEFIEQAHLRELEDARLTPDDMLDRLIADREHLLKDLRVYIERTVTLSDPTTEDFYVERARAHEEALYKLRSLRKASG